MKRIAWAIETHAAAQGLAKSDYAVAGTWDEKTDRISLVFGTDRRIDERQWYAGILQSIRSAFSDHPGITRNIGLVVEHVANLDDVYLHFAGVEDEVRSYRIARPRSRLELNLMDYDIIIGLEIHVQLARLKKMSLGAANGFGGLKPNWQVDPVCSGCPARCR